MVGKIWPRWHVLRIPDGLYVCPNPQAYLEMRASEGSFASNVFRMAQTMVQNQPGPRQ